MTMQEGPAPNLFAVVFEAQTLIAQYEGTLHAFAVHALDQGATNLARESMSFLLDAWNETPEEPFTMPVDEMEDEWQDVARFTRLALAMAIVAKAQPERLPAT